MASCDFAGVSCPNTGCDVMVLASALEKHLKECDHRIVKCVHCGDEMVAKNLEVSQREALVKIAGEEEGGREEGRYVKIYDMERRGRRGVGKGGECLTVDGGTEGSHIGMWGGKKRMRSLMVLYRALPLAYFEEGVL